MSSFLADLGHEVPTALLPSLLTVTLHAPASALGLIEGISDAAAGVARLAGGSAGSMTRPQAPSRGCGYTTTAWWSAAIGAAAAPWQAGILRAGAWAARGLRVPGVQRPARRYRPGATGRAYGFERAMDNLGAIGGPLLAIGLVALVGVRAAIGLSVIPWPRSALAVAIVYAIRQTKVAPIGSASRSASASGPCSAAISGRLMIGVTAFEIGNAAATLLILRATDLFDSWLHPDRSDAARARAVRAVQRCSYRDQHSGRAAR